MKLITGILKDMRRYALPALILIGVVGVLAATGLLKDEPRIDLNHGVFDIPAGWQLLILAFAALLALTIWRERRKPKG